MAGRERDQGNTRRIWMPFVAGVLLVVAAAPYLIAAARWFLVPGTIPESQGGGPIWPWLGVIILFPFWSPLLGAAVCAFFRRAVGVAIPSALVPPVLTILSRPWGWGDVGLGYLVGSSSVYLYLLLTTLHFVLMGAAAILLLFSRRTFTDQETSGLRLYAPPKNWRKLVS